MSIYLILAFSISFMLSILCYYLLYRASYWTNYSEHLSTITNYQDLFAKPYKHNFFETESNQLGEDGIVLFFGPLIPLINLLFIVIMLSDLKTLKKQIQNKLDTLFNSLQQCNHCKFYIREGEVLKHSLHKNDLHCPVCEKPFVSVHNLPVEEYSKISQKLTFKECLELIIAYQKNTHSFRANEEYQRFLDHQTESKITTTIKNFDTKGTRKDKC